jgi:hypothetical protein
LSRLPSSSAKACLVASETRVGNHGRITSRSSRRATARGLARTLVTINADLFTYSAARCSFPSTPLASYSKAARPYWRRPHPQCPRRSSRSESPPLSSPTPTTTAAIVSNWSESSVSAGTCRLAVDLKRTRRRAYLLAVRSDQHSPNVEFSTEREKGQIHCSLRLQHAP